MQNRHFFVIDDDITKTNLTQSFDLITCISVLEHIQTPDDAVHNMFSLLKPNGHLILTFPYTEDSYIRNVYELPNSSYGQDVSYVTQSYSRRDLERWLNADQARVIEQQYWQYWSGEHWTVGDQVIPPKQVGKEDNHQMTCILLKKF